MTNLHTKKTKKENLPIFPRPWVGQRRTARRTAQVRRRSDCHDQSPAATRRVEILCFSPSNKIIFS